MTVVADGLSGGEVAGLIVAVFWALLVCFIAFVLVKLGNVVGETGKLVQGVTDQTVPLLGEVTVSVTHVNAELERVDACWSVATAVGIVDTIHGAEFQAKHLLRALNSGDARRIARALAVEPKASVPPFCETVPSSTARPARLCVPLTATV